MKKKNNRSGVKIRVMIVDDHAGMRDALRTILNSEPDLTVVAEADSGHNALELFTRTTPDVVLMDGSMPGMSGIEATRQLRLVEPAVRIVALTLYQESAYLEEMIAAGARGYVSKTGAHTSVTDAIRAVAAGRTYFDKDIARRSSMAAQDEALIEQLSTDELAVVKRLANGQTNVEIATELELTVPVVERRRSAAMKKLNLRTRTELARLAALVEG
jgi:DNA-binding NarL/FixJ family response regulator